VASRTSAPSRTTTQPTTTTIPRTAVPSTAVPRTTAPSPRPLYSFDDSVPPPHVANTGTDYEKILQSLLDYSDFVRAHREDPALAVKFTAPGSNSDAAARHTVTYLRDHGLRGFVVRNGPSEIRIISRTPSVFTARLTEHIVTQQLVDRAGKVVDQRRMPRPTTTYQFVVVHIGDCWYLADGSIVNDEVHL